jgi:hypothetical protein
MAAQSALLIEAGEQQNRAGTALKMIYARLGGDIDGARSALSQYAETTDATTGAVKPLQEIIRDLGPAWDEMTEGQKQNLAQQVAGNRHYVRFIKLMENRTRLFELEHNALTAIFPAMEERDKRLEDENYQLLILNTQLENRRQLLGERMIPLIKKQREVQLGYYEALIPLMDAEGNSWQKLTSQIATYAIKFNEYMKIFGNFFGIFLGVQQSIIAVQGLAAVMRSMRMEFDQFYQTQSRMGGSEIGRKLTELEILEQQRLKQQQIVQLRHRMSEIDEMMLIRQSQLNAVMNHRAKVENDIGQMKGMFHNQEMNQMGFLRNQYLQLNEIVEQELAARSMNLEVMKFQFQASGSTLASAKIEKEMLEEQIHARQILIAAHQSGNQLSYHESKYATMTRNELQAQARAQIALGATYTHRNRMSTEELRLQVAQNAANQVNVQQEQEELKAQMAQYQTALQIFHLRKAEAQQGLGYLEIIRGIQGAKSNLNFIEGQEAKLKDILLQLDRDRIRSDLVRLGIMQHLEREEQEALVRGIQEAIQAKQSVSDNQKQAMAISQRANAMMGLGMGLQSVSMFMGMFMDAEDAMHGQMIIMGITMATMTVQMYDMAKSMLKTATAAKVLQASLGIGALLGFFVMFGASKLIPNMTNDFEALGDSITYTAVAAADFARGMELYGDLSTDEVLAEEVRLEREIIQLKEMSNRASESGKAIIDQKIQVLEKELSIVSRLHDQYTAIAMLQEDAMQPFIDSMLELRVLQQELSEEDKPAWQRGIAGTFGLNATWFNEQEDVFLQLRKMYEQGMIDLDKIWSDERDVMAGPGFLHGYDDDKMDLADIIALPDEAEARKFFESYTRSGQWKEAYTRLLDTDIITDEYKQMWELILETGSMTADDLAYALSIASEPPEEQEQLWNEYLEGISKQSLTMLEEFANKREELFFGGRLGNLTGAMYKEVITQGVGTLYNHQEVIVSNKFHGFFNPQDTADLIVAAIEAHFDPNGSVVAAISP